jgi:hypothetical protein
MKVISSIPNLYNFERDGISTNDLLKRYALLCDQVVFNRFGAPVGSSDVFGKLPEFIAAMTKADKETARNLASDQRFADIFVDMWEYVDDAEQLERTRWSLVDSETANEVSKYAFSAVRRMNGLGDESFEFNIDDVKEITGDFQADIALNEFAKHHNLGTFPSYAPSVGKILTPDAAVKEESVVQIFDEPLLFPDLSRVNWKDILELRSDRSIVAFRAFIKEQATDQGQRNSSLLKRLSDDVWNLVNDVQPKIGRSILTAIASNLPSPVIINPFGVAASLAEVSKERRMKKTYAHVFFIQDLRSRASNN